MQFILFAIDASFLSSGDSLKMLAQSLQNEVEKLKMVRYTQITFELQEN